MHSNRSRVATVLLVSGSDPQALHAARETEADRILYDLDDTVPPSEKARACDSVAEAITSFERASVSLAVRVNGPSGVRIHQDLFRVVTSCGDRLDAVCVPRIGSAAECIGVDWLLARLEREAGVPDRIDLDLQLESARGISHATRLMRASDRIGAVTFGAGDMTADMDVALIDPEAPAGVAASRLVRTARMLTALVGRAHAVRALDGPHYVTPDEFTDVCENASHLGCDGIWCVSEEQVKIANGVFSGDRVADRS